jgi:hypothetical protein
MRRYFVEYKKCEKGGCKKGRGGYNSIADGKRACIFNPLFFV